MPVRALRRLVRALLFRARRVRDRVFDALDRVRGRDELVPPRRLLSGDYSEFQRIGEEFRGYFVELAGLSPSDAVLDVGCGPGRMAVPLTGYLSAEGRYEGFDVVAREISWCTEHISPRYPQFRFRRVDVRNAHYNPQGAIAASELRFPYDDASFDLVILASVFTHMVQPDVERYLGEVRRVLRPGGRCFATYFLLHDDSRRRIDADESYFSFAGGQGDVRFEDPSDPEATVAYGQDLVRSLHERHELPIRSIDYGYWSGRRDYLTWQDVVVAEREAARVP